MSDEQPVPRRRGRGHPPFVPTDKERHAVEVLVANGISQNVICKVIGIDHKTLTKYFKEEIAHGFDNIKAEITAAVVRSALMGNVAAQKYWLFCKGGTEWKPLRPEEDSTITMGGTTIIIKGGLPAPPLESKPNGHDSPNGEADPNGADNGAGAAE